MQQVFGTTDCVYSSYLGSPGLHAGSGLYQILQPNHDNCGPASAMKKYNQLLERQLREHYPATPSPELEPLLEAVSQSYDDYERDQGQVARAMSLNSDELMATNESLRKVNAELDRFVYSVSHDLRAPIASVLGLIQIARSEQNREEQKRYFGLMEGSLQRLDSFIHDIIDYSRNNRLESKPEPIFFNELIEEVAASLRYMPDAFTVELIKEFSIEATFYTDRQRLRVILTNLISNAVRYYNPRQLRPYIRINVKTTESQAILQIEDNGIGIEEEYLPRIFDMFFRAHQESKGSGLGLYIVKEMIKKLEGEIEISSIPRVGTCFEITLPNLPRQ